MKVILSNLGLDGIPYMMDLAEAAWRITLVLVLAWLAWTVCARLVGLLRRRAEAHSDDPEEFKRIETMAQVFRYLAGVVVTVVTLMLVLGELGISIAPILATAGVAGIAIGFGAQSLVKDYFSGVVLLLENQIRKGDVIEAGGKSGLVEAVTLRYVRLRDYGGTVHFVPNGAITTVSNMSREFAFAVLDIGIAYRSDIDLAYRVIRETAEALQTDSEFGPRLLDAVEIAGIDAWAESAIVIKVRFKVRALEQWNVKREFLRRLKYAFDDARIEIPFPHLTVFSGDATIGSSMLMRAASADPAG